MDNRQNNLKANIYLSLGTNLGERWYNLKQAVMALTSIIDVKTISPVYQTKPWGLTNQPDFLNICLFAKTTLSPFSLLNTIKNLESALGRQSAEHWGPRLIDIDILFYNTIILQTKQLTLPHQHLANRSFVLVPLNDIAPHLCHPQTGLSVRQMLTMLNNSDVKKLHTPLFNKHINQLSLDELI